MKEFCDSLTKEARWWGKLKGIEEAGEKVDFGKVLTFPLRLTGHIVKNVGQSLAERPITTLLVGGGMYAGYRQLKKKRQQSVARTQQVDYVIPGGY